MSKLSMTCRHLQPPTAWLYSVLTPGQRAPLSMRLGIPWRIGNLWRSFSFFVRHPGPWANVHPTTIIMIQSRLFGSEGSFRSKPVSGSHTHIYIYVCVCSYTNTYICVYVHSRIRKCARAQSAVTRNAVDRHADLHSV